MSEEGRSTFAEALTRFSMTSKDVSSESEEEHSEALQLHEPDSLPLDKVEMMRINSAPNVYNSSLEGKESPELQKIESKEASSPGQEVLLLKNQSSGVVSFGLESIQADVNDTA